MEGLEGVGRGDMGEGVFVLLGWGVRNGFNMVEDGEGEGIGVDGGVGGGVIGGVEEEIGVGVEKVEDKRLG